MTAVANSVYTAAQFNTFVRDNLNETAPGKSTQVSSHFVGNGLNSIVERLAAVDNVGTVETTTSTSYTDLATSGPAITTDTGTSAMVFIRAGMENSGAGNETYMTFEVTGASSFAASDTFAIQIDGLDAGARIRNGAMYMISTLTGGSNTFTAKYKVDAGTGTFRNRQLAVFPF